MDTKKVLQQLLKIADNQQKAIAKLAQALSPQDLTPAPTTHSPAKVFYDAMTPEQKATLSSGPEVHGSEMRISFKPGQVTQANYDGLLKLLQALTSQNKIQDAYTLKYVP